jgi:hypothetical protein
MMWTMRNTAACCGPTTRHAGGLPAARRTVPWLLLLAALLAGCARKKDEGPSRAVPGGPAGVVLYRIVGPRGRPAPRSRLNI